jgi:NADPH:quinone reductase-like Zn-dependent oxidoreductase
VYSAQSDKEFHMMKAARFKTYGNNQSIVIEEVPVPTPGADELLVKVKATTVTAVDAIFRSGRDPFARMATGVFSPKIKTLGTELAGVVEAVGKNVTSFNVGDEIIADSGTNYGAHAEYVIVAKDDPIVIKPSFLSFKEAAAVTYGSLTALPFLRDHGKIKKGDQVLIIGASGSVGSYAVQLGVYYEARVTAVCGARNALLVKSLGAHDVIDYTKTPLRDLECQYDIIFDSVGKYSFSNLRHLMKPEGRYLTTVLGVASLVNMLKTTFTRKKSILALTGLRKNDQKMADLRFIADLFTHHRLSAVIDKEFDFDSIQDAFDYVEKGHKTGNVVINV